MGGRNYSSAITSLDQLIGLMTVDAATKYREVARKRIGAGAGKRVLPDQLGQGHERTGGSIDGASSHRLSSPPLTRFESIAKGTVGRRRGQRENIRSAVSNLISPVPWSCGAFGC